MDLGELVPIYSTLVAELRASRECLFEGYVEDYLKTQLWESVESIRGVLDRREDAWF
jgi:hypothetical protein